MNTALKKMRGDKEGWYKVSDLVAGLEIARPRADFEATPGAASGDSDIVWDEIVSIKPVGREQVYDIEVAGTHNFVGNGIFAHNTAVLKADANLSVTGNVAAADLVVPESSFASAAAAFGLASTTEPSAALTADGTGISLFKLAAYDLASEQALASTTVARLSADEAEMSSLEVRIDKLESGAIGMATSTSPFSTSTLASAFASLGAYIQKGIAQFGTLVADQFVAATNSAGASSAGTVTIPAGNTVAQVENAYVLPTSKIFVTFTASTTGSWFVSDKQPGSFRVVLSSAQPSDISFDYFLVQTEGQIATSTLQSEEQGAGAGSSLNGGNSPSTGSTTLTAGSSGQESITILGDNPVHISVGGVYVEPGVVVQGGTPYTTYINGVQQEVNASTIDTSTPTTYVITYSSTDASGAAVTARRSVIVGNPDGTVNIGQQGAGAGGSSTNTGSTTPADTVAPIVTLNGAAAIQLTVGDTFTDPGATASDAVDGDLTSKIAVTGKVDAATAGMYTLTYTATDAAGNTSSASRVVSVVASPSTPSGDAGSSASSTPAGQ